MRRALVVGLLALGLCSLADADELRFAVGQTWAPPFAQISEGRLQGGLMFELMEQIAANAGAEARYTLLPAKRVDAALAQGEVDLHCLVSPDWVEPAAAPALRWSVPVLRLEDWLVAPPGAPVKPLDLATQRQLVVGMVLGYNYPTLASALKAKRLQREDAPTQERLLEKLLRGRTPYAVLNRLVVDDYNRSRPPAERLVPLQQIDVHHTHCLLATRTGIESQRILAAVRKLVESAQLQTILARYR